MQWARTSLWFLILIIGIRKINCLTCLSGSSAISARDCSHVQKCTEYEECYTDQYVSTAGRILFDFGCRTSTKCQSSLTDSHHGNGYTNTCHRCCRDNLCNAKLCGEVGFDSNNGPVCFSCPVHRLPYDCDEIEQCGRDQVCHLQRIIQNNKIEYTSKCTLRTDCDNLLHIVAQVFGRRRSTNQIGSEQDCHIKCCDEDLCNAGACVTGNTSTIQTTAAPTTGYCSTNPCVHGTCFDGPNGYLCQCNQGYHGNNCDQGDTHCSPNPCQHGSCFNGQTIYVCQCESGFTGTNCDRAVVADHCLSHPCSHGTCVNSASSFTCHCFSGFQGWRCDQAVVADHCLSHPCSHGTCVNSASSFTCHCFSGFQGGRCDQAVVTDHCLSHPCSHGTCVNSASSFTCHCFSGFQGERCDQAVVTDHCLSHPCSHGTCVNSASSFTCHCSSGFQGERCDQAGAGCSPKYTITDGSFEHGASHWERYSNGFTVISSSHAPDGGSIIRVADGGASQVLDFSSSPISEFYLSGYSRFTSHTSVSNSADYSIYCDLQLTDGNYVYGKHADFPTYGTTGDWHFRELHVVTNTPIQIATCYALFRNGAGSAEADFDRFTLTTCKAGCAYSLKDGSFETGSGWINYFGGYTRLSSSPQDGNHYIRVTNGAAEQHIHFYGPSIRQFTLSGYSRSHSASVSDPDDYSIYCDITNIDDKEIYGFAAPFSTSTSGWQKAILNVNSQRPIRHAICYAMFRNGHGQVDFDNFQLESCS